MCVQLSGLSCHWRRAWRSVPLPMQSRVRLGSPDFVHQSSTLLTCCVLRRPHMLHVRLHADCCIRACELACHQACDSALWAPPCAYLQGQLGYWLQRLGHSRGVRAGPAIGLRLWCALPQQFWTALQVDGRFLACRCASRSRTWWLLWSKSEACLTYMYRKWAGVSAARVRHGVSGHRARSERPCASGCRILSKLH